MMSHGLTAQSARTSTLDPMLEATLYGRDLHRE